MSVLCLKYTKKKHLGLAEFGNKLRTDTQLVVKLSVYLIEGERP